MHLRMAPIRPNSGISPQVLDLTLHSCQIPRQEVTKRKAHISAAPASTHSSSGTGPLCKLRHATGLRHQRFPRVSMSVPSAQLSGSLGSCVTVQAKGWAKMEIPYSLQATSLIKNEKTNPINALCKEKSG